MPWVELILIVLGSLFMGMIIDQIFWDRYIRGWIRKGFIDIDNRRYFFTYSQLIPKRTEHGKRLDGDEHAVPRDEE